MCWQSFGYIEVISGSVQPARLTTSRSGLGLSRFLARLLNSRLEELGAHANFGIPKMELAIP
jgi:hypothetical protein